MGRSGGRKSPGGVQGRSHSRGSKFNKKFFTFSRMKRSFYCDFVINEYNHFD